MTTSHFSLYSFYFMELKSTLGASASSYFTELQKTGSRLDLPRFKYQSWPIVTFSDDDHELDI